MGDNWANNIRPLALSLLTGFLYALSFPPFNFSLLGWVCFLPLLWIETTSLRARFLHGFYAGFVANLIIFFWLWKTFQAANVNFMTTLGAWVLLSSVLAIYFGVFSLLLKFQSQSRLFPLWAGAIWVCLEYLRSILLTGFPWAIMGHTQVANLALLQIVSLTGVEGISFLLVCANVGIFLFLKNITVLNKGRNTFSLSAKIFTPLLIFLSILSLIIGFGLFRLKTTFKIHSTPIKIALLQGNINQYQKWDDKYEAAIRNQYARLAELAARENPDLIIWPESAIPGWYPNENQYREWVETLVKKTGTAHIMGAVTAISGKEYNAAFYLNSQGSVVDMYAKQHLVPFGEYIPFGKFLGKWVPYLGQLGTFDAGEQTKTFTLGRWKLAPNICFEAIFPSLIRQSLRGGGNIIINLTNDGWYLDSAAPEQHFNTNIFRAVELGCPVVRVANTGISAVIDPWGRVKLKSPLMKSGMYLFDQSLPDEPLNTFYLKHGPIFMVGCWLFVGMLILRRKKS